MPERLTQEEIEDALIAASEWELQGNRIVRTFQLKNFAEAMELVNDVAKLAEEAGHHPDIDIRWNKVRLSLSTHSKGGLTQADFDLSAKIDALEG